MVHGVFMETLSMSTLKQKLNDAKTRAYSLKTKKAQTKAWATVREIEREILSHLYEARNKVARHSIKGTVMRNSSASDDQIPVETAEYGVIWLSPTTDENAKSWYAHTCCIEYSKGQELVIEMECDVSNDGLFLSVHPMESRGGTLNEIQYAELCKRDNLAFFKYPNSNGVTGLFAQPSLKAVSRE
jgi:hypothetical protein